LYLLFAAELPNSELSDMISSVAAATLATLPLPQSARIKVAAEETVVPAFELHSGAASTQQAAVVSSSKIWRLLKSQIDRLLLKEIVSFL
jgi:hypothetical protein